MSEVKILVADDHPIVRRGVAQIIDSDPGLKVVAEAGDGQQALDLIREMRPDIALLDINLPRLDGFEIAMEISRRDLPVKVIFLTMHAEEELFNEAMDIGVQGYVLKESAITEIVEAVKKVAQGQCAISSSLTSYLMSRNRRAERLAAQSPGLMSLTPAERRILQMIAEYKTSKEIADELCIHYRTVENHRTNICRKLDIHGNNALLRFALRHKSELLG
ncbi:MAG: response regulator transcription factor [Acidobacteriota bacterium]